MENASNTKTCPKCGRTLMADNFYKRSNGSLYTYCKECVKANNRKYRNTPPSPRIDYSAIMLDFNTRFAGVLPAVTVMTEKRKAAVRARIGEHGMDSIANVFDNIAASGFLKGHNNHNWKADFDWVFRPTNYVKILEGNYTNTGYGREKRQRFGATPPDDFAGKGSTKL